ncbi:MULTISPECIES: efflux RND transporter periplasmic adaptor subunit [Methylotenera]|uniref:efflux RND transporter periplasmic adaptor subunit n=1 Tax=Methylotenera TaxID=359407 RepID=UPI000362528A|nr:MULTISPECIES: efflux RND transporter periplasmic adaptor subunit [Methylotenera]
MHFLSQLRSLNTGNLKQSDLKLSNFKKSKLTSAGLIIIATVAITLQGCGKKPDAAASAPPAMPVSYVSVQPTNVPMSVESVAQTEGAREIEVRPRVGGIILKKMFEEGESVKAGQVLFIIDPEPFQIALAQAKAQAAGQGARITQTSRESNRLKELLETQSVSQREYDNATSDVSISQADMMQSQANIKEAELNLSYTKVTAPVSGIAGRFQFSEGALVTANTSLLTTIVQLSPIWARFSLSTTELASLGGHVNSNSVTDVTLILPNGTEYAQKGKLNFTANSIDPTLGTQELRATFNNEDKALLPGQFVRARVTTGEREGVFLVPQTSVLSGDLGKFVYVINAKNEATATPVVVGEWHGKDWIILDGLNANDKVIVDNLIKLRPGAAVQPKVFVQPTQSTQEPASATDKSTSKSTAKSKVKIG